VPSISQFLLATPAPDAHAPAPDARAPALDARAPAPDARAPALDAHAPAPDAAALSAIPQFDVDAPWRTLHALLLESVMSSTISQGRQSSLQMPTRASCASRWFLARLNCPNV
jgi:hypothetical protein